jgi:hypothetical protein
MNDFREEKRLFQSISPDRRQVLYIQLKRMANQKPLTRAQRWVARLTILTIVMAAFYAAVLPSISFLLIITCGYVTAFCSVTAGTIAERVLNV